jgi:hypothetical protein
VNGVRLAKFDDPGRDQESAFSVRIKKLQHQLAANRQLYENRSGYVGLDVTVTTRRCNGANGCSSSKMLQPVRCTFSTDPAGRLGEERSKVVERMLASDLG